MLRGGEAEPEADVARPIHRGAPHPARVRVGRVRALLVDEGVAGRIPDFVPAHPRAGRTAGRPIGIADHVVIGDEGRVSAHVPVGEPEHHPIAQRVEDRPIQLRDAAPKLVAEPLKGRRRHQHGVDGAVEHVVPVDVVPVDDERVRAEEPDDRLALAGRRRQLTVEIRRRQTAHLVGGDLDALLVRGSAREHLYPIEDADPPAEHPRRLRRALVHVVGDVVAVRPDTELRVVVEGGVRERVEPVLPGWIGRPRHGDALQVRTRELVLQKVPELRDDPSVGERVVPVRIPTTRDD